MIEHNAENISKFKNKVVFAPNGFGKTRFSYYLKDFFENENKTVGLFSSKEIDGLISFNNNKIFFGETSKQSELIESAKTSINKSDVVNPFIIKNYGGLVIFERTSFLCSYLLGNNTKNIINKFIRLYSLFEYESDRRYKLNDTVEIDKNLDFDLFNDACDFVLKIENLFKEYNPSDYRYFKNQIFTTINPVIKRGRKFKFKNNSNAFYISFSDFIKHFKNASSCFPQNTRDELYRQYESFERRCYDALNNLRSKINVIVFDGVDNNPISMYIWICHKNTSDLLSHIGEIKIDENNSLISLCNSIKFWEREIKDYKEKIVHTSNFADLIKHDLNELFMFRSAVSINVNQKNLSLSVSVNRRKRFDIRNILSESEIKRLCLIVLKAQAKIIDYDYLILDDPIDSYDDYYLGVACNYIASFIKEKSDKMSWYLFTNNVNCLTNLGAGIGDGAVFCSDNPDIIFSDGDVPPGGGDDVVIELSPIDLNIINVNELCLMAKYLNPSLHISKLNGITFADDSLPLLSFCVTLRNFNDVVNVNYNNVNFYTNFPSDCSKKIEHCFMHYDCIPIATHSVSTDLINGEIFDMYENLLSITNPDVKKFNSSTTISVDDRLACLKKGFSSRTSGNKFLNYLLYKILAVSELKFEIEKKLIDTILSKGSLTQADVIDIIMKHGLYHKLKEAKDKADITTDIDLQNFVNNGFSIYSRHCNLINDFDHALARMIPPYLSTSILDMKKLKTDIDSWKY